MAVIGTYNGASIIAMPEEPGIRQFQLNYSNVNAMNQSPFTAASQVQAFPGGDMWSGDITFPPLDRDEAAGVSAFLAETQGMLNCFPLTPPNYVSPRGSVKGTSKPVVSGTNNAMVNTLTTRGWKKSTYGLLLPGDFLQIGVLPADPTQNGIIRLHQVMSPVNSDANGNATLNVWPTLREAVTDGTVLVLNNPCGLFRLATNKRSMLTTETRQATTTLSVMEAR